MRVREIKEKWKERERRDKKSGEGERKEKNFWDFIDTPNLVGKL